MAPCGEAVFKRCSIQFFWSDKPVSVAAHSLDVLGAGGVFFDFKTQPAHVYIQGARIADPFFTPHLGKQLVATQSAPGVLHQDCQQVKFAR